MDELDGLGPERMPDQLARTARWLNGDIDLGQPAVVSLERQQQRIGRNRLPELAEHRILSSKEIADVVIGKAVLGRDQPLVAPHAAIHAGEEGEALLHGDGDLRLLSGKLACNTGHALFIELQ